MLKFQLKSNPCPRIEEGWEGTGYLSCGWLPPLDMAHVSSLAYPNNFCVFLIIQNRNNCICRSYQKEYGLYRCRTLLILMISTWRSNLWGEKKSNALFKTFGLFISFHSWEGQSHRHPKFSSLDHEQRGIKLKWPWACSSGPAGDMCSGKTVLLQDRWSAGLPSHPLPLLLQGQWWEK